MNKYNVIKSCSLLAAGILIVKLIRLLYSNDFNISEYLVFFLVVTILCIKMPFNLCYWGEKNKKEKILKGSNDPEKKKEIRSSLILYEESMEKLSFLSFFLFMILNIYIL